MDKTKTCHEQTMIRKTANWGKDIPLKRDTEEQLITMLSETYGADKVRRAVLCCPVAVEKVIDNERDAQMTILNHRKNKGAIKRRVEPKTQKIHRYTKSYGDGSPRGFCRCGELKDDPIHCETEPEFEGNVYG